MKKRAEAGRTAGETIFALIVFSAIVVVIYVLLRPGQSGGGPLTPPSKPKYKCLTNADGLIPLKAVVLPRDGAVLFSAPNAAAATGERLPMFESYFPLRRREDYIELANDPMSDKSIGWVDKKSVLLWPTRETLRPNKENTERQPLRLWVRLQDVGRAEPAFEEDLEADPAKPYPVLSKSGRNFQIAMTWQKSDYSDGGVATAWTSPIDIPDDARFYCLVTRNELKRVLESVTAALIDLASGKHAENPIVKLLKGNVEITAGDKIDTGDDDLGLMRKILRDLQNPLKIASKQSSEIRSESTNMKRQLDRLRRFYLTNDNFDGRGMAWLPEEDLPGN
jgi:hypothetical protein